MKKIAAFTLVIITASSFSVRAQDDSQQVPPNVLRAVTQSMNDPDSTPASCDSPMAMVIMMHAIQADVGDRIQDQLVDLRKPRKVSIKPGDWSCRVITVWGQHPAVEGVFRQYKNAIGRIVYSWNGEPEVRTQQQ